MKTVLVLAALGVLLPAIPAHAERLCSCKSGPSEVGNSWVGNGQTTIHRERNVIKEHTRPGPSLELREHGGGTQGHGMHHQGDGGGSVKIKP